MLVDRRGALRFNLTQSIVSEGNVDQFRISLSSNEVLKLTELVYDYAYEWSPFALVLPSLNATIPLDTKSLIR